MALSIHNILVPVDFSEASEHSLLVAMDLAKTLGAKLCVLYVYQIPVYAFPDGALITGPEIATQLSEAGQNGLDSIIQKHGGSGIPMSPVLRQGTAHEEILNVAKEVLADLIVLGTHGRGRIAHALLGSVTERVIRTSPIPVMTIRHQAHK